MKARLLPLLAVVVTGLLLVHGFATPQPVQQPVPGLRDPYSTGVAGRAGAPQTSAHAEAQGRAEETTGGAPSPSGGIGNPATFWKPGYKPRPTPRVVVSKGVVGDATYYCRPGISRCTVNHPFGMYAAAGPEVRAMLGPDWRGQFVIVTDETGRGVVVQLIDWCACSGSHVIDLYWTAYQGMVNPVTVKEEP